MHSLRACTNTFWDSYGWDSKEDISDAEQLPVSSLKRNDSPAELHQAVYWHRCIQVWFDSISLIFALISLIFTYILTHTNLMWLRSMQLICVMLSLWSQWSCSCITLGCNSAWWWTLSTVVCVARQLMYRKLMCALIRIHSLLAIVVLPFFSESCCEDNIWAPD